MSFSPAKLDGQWAGATWPIEFLKTRDFKMEEGRKAFLANRQSSYPPPYQLFLHTLALVLQKLVPGSVLVPVDDPDIQVILAGGRLIEGEILLRPLEANNCHDNVFDVCREERGWIPATGYALSADGLWRSHSWAVGVWTPAFPVILETTEVRLCYFGITAHAFTSEPHQVIDPDTPEAQAYAKEYWEARNRLIPKRGS